jgi:DNA-binding transcriptional MerR regulator
MAMRWKELRNRKFVGAAELADRASRLVEEVVPPQERGSVSEMPNERMIRYYITEGLLAPPLEKSGTSQVFGYLHLLQVLVVKKLQAENLTIRKVREMLQNRDTAYLEDILGIGIGPPQARKQSSREAATEYLLSLLRTPAPQAPLPPARMPAAAQPAAPLERCTIAEGIAAFSVPNWKRIEIAPGLELHLREDFRLGSGSGSSQQLQRRILREIEKHDIQSRKRDSS